LLQVGWMPAWVELTGSSCICARCRACPCWLLNSAAHWLNCRTSSTLLQHSTVQYVNLTLSTTTPNSNSRKLAALKGNSTLKNISPKINIHDKWIYVSVIKVTMQIRYRRILKIKLLISRNVFLHGGRSCKPSSLFHISWLTRVTAITMDVRQNYHSNYCACMQNAMW